MKYLPGIIVFVCTITLVILLDRPLTVGGNKTPRLGYFLSPQHGFWKNAEPKNQDWNATIAIPGLKDSVSVYIDENLIPHVYAENDEDMYKVQGYLHAKFRLWQMEFQTHAAAGRLSEIMGEKVGSTDFVAIDKMFRRIGMVYAAEKSIEAMKSSPDISAATAAYAEGVNAYIKQLGPQDLPFEYKLLNYQPEEWTPFKSALFLKYMSFDLTWMGLQEFTMTNTRDYFGYDDFAKLFPIQQPMTDPIIPKGTAFAKPSIQPKAPSNVDSTYFYLNKKKGADLPVQTDPNNGSNNWAVSGQLTASGKPILCSDPHLGLNLPSLWFEMQLSGPNSNAYGASFPGSPAIIIGFNDSIAWGVTNAGRDVKDFYEVQFKDASMQEYMYNGEWKKSTFREEKIMVRDQCEKIEKIAMTEWGPVMFDTSYKNMNEDGKYYAVRWTAHDASNELLTFYQLNRAKNHADYLAATEHFYCPGQNFVFASHTGDIAIRQQGKFPARWERQGEFLMSGTDSQYRWQGMIPSSENPYILNPARGFVSSANQPATDANYPYYLGAATNFPLFRGIAVNQYLASLKEPITPQHMMQMQTDNYNVFAAMALPLLLKELEGQTITATEQKYVDIAKSWNLRNDINEIGATVFHTWWDSLEVAIYADEYAQANVNLRWPDETVILEQLKQGNLGRFVDDITTVDKQETIQDLVLKAFKNAISTIDQKSQNQSVAWGVWKDTKVSHLLKIPALSRLHVPIGGANCIINATTQTHGPSWRMVVHLTEEVEAYCVYPGGQSGNPGSHYYDRFLNDWASGKYHKALFVKKQKAAQSNEMKWKIAFIPA